MPILKPLPIAGACLLIVLHATAQNSFDIIQHKPPVPKKLNWLESFSIGMFYYHKNYNTLSTDFPYTSKDVSSGVTTANNYKAALANFFTRPAAIADFSVEAQTRHSGGYFCRFSVGDDGFLNFMPGYELIIPLSKSYKNEFVFKPCISLCFYRFTAKFDSTINNNQKIITIAGKTFNDTFNYVDDDDNWATTQASYIELKYIQNNIGVFPQLCIARQSPRHQFYYSVSVGWLQQINESRSVIDISPYDDQGHSGKRQFIPVHFKNNFSGFTGSVAVGLYFHRM